MSYSTIYDMMGNVITDGVQSQAACDATINTARSIARHRRHSVIVEDRGTEECYRITPAGHRWAAPTGWTPEWGATLLRDRSPPPTP
jgi:hypothetical protein